MLSIDVSKFSYSMTLAQVLHVILGGAAILGYCWYSPVGLNITKFIAESHPFGLVAGVVLGLFVSYILGVIIYAPFGLFLNCFYFFYRWRAGKKYWCEGQALSSSWKQIAGLYLQKVGIEKPEEANKTGWNSWLRAFHQIFPEDQLVNARMGALMAGLGFILLWLAISYPAARSTWVFLAIPGAIGPGFQFMCWAIIKTEDRDRSAIRQQQTMLTFLLKEARKEIADTASKPGNPLVEEVRSIGVGGGGK